MAIRLDSNCYKAFLAKGNAFYLQKKFNETIECYNKVIQLKPNDANGFGNKSKCLYRLNRYQEALDFKVIFIIIFIIITLKQKIKDKALASDRTWQFNLDYLDAQNIDTIDLDTNSNIEHVPNPPSFHGTSSQHNKK